MTLDEIEWRLKNPDQAPPSPKKQQQKQKEQPKAEAAAALVVKEAPPPPKKEAKVEVGESMGVKRDPLSMIKVGGKQPGSPVPRYLYAEAEIWFQPTELYGRPGATSTGATQVTSTFIVSSVWWLHLCGGLLGRGCTQTDVDRHLQAAQPLLVQQQLITAAAVPPAAEVQGSRTVSGEAPQAGEAS